MAASDQSIVVLGCFDTKGEVFAWLRECLLGQGERVLTINTGVLGTTDRFLVDIESEAVAEAAGTTLTDLRTRRDRGQAVDCMGRGAAKVLSGLVEEGKVKAVIGMGGGGGTYIALAAMQAVPLGTPKLCLSTVAAKDLSRQVGDKDITLMPSVVDVAGLNSIIGPLVQQAAAAISAMAGVARNATTASAGSIAISMFGNTTACVDACTELLTRQGYEVLAFHATGVGGKTMEALIREGCFDAVLDLTTTELADDLCGGICSAGPERLTAAARMGIPQVVVPGCLDMVNFAHPDTVPKPYRQREMYRWAPDVTLMRTNAEENRQLGEQLAQKLNPSAAPVAVLLPLKGISQIDAGGGVFFRPETNRVLFDAIQTHAAEHIEVREVDAHINDQAFAEVLVQTLLDLIQKDKITKTGT
ncbi:Tm-1-like ATP-binding domain-containing protein [Telluribacter humicola]|uniref:Tm-1-like ATP-binding domain-containing protein n=1 Tax=Telluribacter humicola TaxID=1720261 RepID=UPI001A963F88|nr:Tm-1-like ATP-binding domain-containing protein [Telluribacter humicola]